MSQTDTPAFQFQGRLSSELPIQLHLNVVVQSRNKMNRYSRSRFRISSRSAHDDATRVPHWTASLSYESLINLKAQIRTS